MTARADTDQALIAAAQRGDASAFDELVRRHTTTMYRVAVRILGNSSEAEDAVQDAWVSAWRSLKRFRGDAAPSTWLYRVVTNAALAQIRRRRPTVPLDVSDEAVGGLFADHRDPEGQAVRNEEATMVHRAIATLEPSQRVPLVLHEFEGMGYEEIAEVLDVGAPALRSRLHRARLALLARLKEMHHG
ncbi:RNA polymerase sigma-70 factor (ECF subfamily) [Saccharopolyspora erythraea NRRL 2338]|uniref:RNA polymerase sigma factor n=2 Tax=Saccharopolyspora erythraea TaxID=1836 RepID=A4FAV7_SACEN|nr:sigma-70 family RNA polymerase sigma factor [Saccharopolyspora erythraea]EQD87575.1 RNA polymerase sigma70 factor [Saccharopolyspora erythraea D]PFG94964.1 RNA polymerase sigma-70 factor (ECF subfamily) [Saccharopolyspora erythraea NRRL 2338]QRK91656.1 sigma-70 family RNA polymerase sigma factor [Saccharopolyspora erythraea]CAM01182.1 putative RNA polymerase sigma factor [Saccharopolyspora erythraea NRRL 2338]